MPPDFRERAGAVMDAARSFDYLDYRVRWRTGDTRPGRHASRQIGAGGDFRAYRPFWQLPDARRIDVRRSILDPSGDIMVRQTENRSSITLVLAADLSHSMQAAAQNSKLSTLAALAQAASSSALRAGDAFGFLGFDERPRTDLLARPTRSWGAAADAITRLRALSLSGRSAEGLTRLAAHLPGRRCLVLLVSDFLMPLDLLDNALFCLAQHDVAPVVLEEPGEEEPPPLGLLRLRDAESGRTRLLLMRPEMRRRWQRAREDRKTALDRLFLRHGHPAFHVRGALDIAALGEHLRTR